jgi:hypothetical protein
MTMFHLGDIVTSLAKTTLVPGGAEVSSEHCNISAGAVDVD